MQMMVAPLLKWCGLSCREFAELCSLRLDRPLTGFEQVRYRFHAGMCEVCRRLPAQFDAIREAIHSCHEHDEPVAAESACRLDDEARERIVETLCGIADSGKEDQ